MIIIITSIYETLALCMDYFCQVGTVVTHFTLAETEMDVFFRVT